MFLLTFRNKKGLQGILRKFYAKNLDNLDKMGKFEKEKTT